MRIALVSIIALFAAAQAYAGIALVGAGTIPGYAAVDSNYTFKGKLGLGAGVLLSVPVARMVRVELGAIYTSHKFDVTDQTFTAAGLPDQFKFSNNQIIVPALVRLSLFHFVSLGLGGYATQGLGKITSTDADGSNAQSYTYGELGFKSRDYGAMGSLRLGFWIVPGLTFFVDGRYMLGLVDLGYPVPGQATASYKTRDMLFLSGINFGF